MRTFAHRAPIALDVGDVHVGRIAPNAEVAAYAVVAAVVGDAARGTASAATVTLKHDGGRLTIDLRHDGACTSPAVARHLADRVGALGGTVTVAPGHVRAELACASS